MEIYLCLEIADVWKAILWEIWNAGPFSTGPDAAGPLLTRILSVEEFGKPWF